MTQPQRGSARGEVSDLRNIVDRLDMMMSGSSAPAGRASAHTRRDEMILELAERVQDLERDVEELRTLVNHLMTIATWQAKVTATLVGEELADDDEDADPAVDRDVPPAPQASRRRRAVDPHGEEGPPQGHHRGSTRTLDDDIDGILGASPSPRHDAGPSDFGI